MTDTEHKPPPQAGEIAALIESRIGQDFDGECHLTEDEARQAAALIRDFLAAPPEGGRTPVGWRVIADEAPPKDRVFLIAYAGEVARRLEPHERVYEARWDERQETWTARNGFLVHTDATHWQPLPTPPVHGGGEKP